MASGVLQGGQALILPQAFAEVPGGLRVETVVAEAADATQCRRSKNEQKASADSCLLGKVGGGRAYSTLFSVWLTRSTSAMYFPSSGPVQFPDKLQTKFERMRQKN